MFVFARQHLRSHIAQLLSDSCQLLLQLVSLLQQHQQILLKKPWHRLYL